MLKPVVTVTDQWKFSVSNCNNSFLCAESQLYMCVCAISVVC